ncbi:MAG: hypothetical protein JXQ23_08580 [Clostridia bacterium]|nr:hypothetical protein [Clostridia bacterium]
MNIRKIILFIIIISSMLLFSCNKKQEEPTITLSGESGNVLINESYFLKEIKSLDVETLDLESINGPINIYMSDRGDGPYSIGNFDYKPWSEYIFDTYGILVDIGLYDETEFLNGTTEISKIDGLIEIGSYADKIQYLARDNKIKRLNEILDQSVAFENLPDYVKYAFADDKGNIWAIPKVLQIELVGRYYKKAILEQFSLSTPETLSEMYELFLNVNKKTGMKGLTYYHDYMLFSFKDIFAANGCYASNMFFSTISYDQNTMSYEDFLLTEEALETIVYINVLKENELMIENSNRLSADFQNYFEKINALSSNEINNYFNASNEINDNYEFVPGIRGSMQEKYIDLITYGTGYALPIDTSISDQAVASFVNLFYGTKEGKNDAYFGIKNKDYKVDDKTIIFYDDGESNNDFQPVMGIRNILDVEYISNTTADFTLKLTNPIAYLKNSLGIDESAFHYQSPLYSSVYLTSEGNSSFGLNSLSEYLLSDIYIDPSDFMETYRRNVRERGYDKSLYEYNQLLGYETVYKY